MFALTSLSAQPFRHYTYWMLKKISHLSIVGPNFVKPEPIFKIISLLERAQHWQQRPCNVCRHTLIMLLNYLGKLKQLQFAAKLEKNAYKRLQFLHDSVKTELFTYLLLLFMVSVR